MSNQVEEVRSFEIGSDEEFAIVAGSAYGEQRSIYANPEPGRYAIVSVDAFETNRDRPNYADELAVDAATVVSSVKVTSGDRSTLRLLKGEEIALRRSTPGVYLTLRLPYDKD